MKKAVAILLLLAYLTVAPPLVRSDAFAQTAAQNSVDQRIRSLEGFLAKNTKEVKTLTHERLKLNLELADLSAQIEKIKSDQNASFMDKMRLKRLLPEHLELSKKLEALDQRIGALTKRGDRVREKLVSAYDEKIAATAQAMTREKNRDKALHLVREYFELLEKARQHRTAADIDMAGFSVTLDPLDSYQKVSEKISLLRDRAAKLKNLVKQIDKQIKRLRTEKSLATEMQQMIEEGALFEDGVIYSPSPRSLPVRRPDERPDDTGADDTTGFDEAGVHTSPLNAGQGGESAVMLDSIRKEIRRLEQEKQSLLRLVKMLEAKIREFEKRARELRGSGK